MSSKIQFDKDNDNSSAENHDKWTDDDDDDDDNDNDHLMKINPLKLLGNEGIVKPLQFIRGHIQPPWTYETWKKKSEWVRCTEN